MVIPSFLNKKVLKQVNISGELLDPWIKKSFYDSLLFRIIIIIKINEIYVIKFALSFLSFSRKV